MPLNFKQAGEIVSSLLLNCSTALRASCVTPDVVDASLFLACDPHRRISSVKQGAQWEPSQFLSRI
ncbi:hypothetical protein LY76DRAFT_586977 [Colletotrichum caudatum]|nr:hypothetical protein LY76DRAFT_586977 [Colletotrichum caudatum]